MQIHKEKYEAYQFLLKKNKEHLKIIYPGPCVFCCVRIIVKNKILNRLTNYTTRMCGGRVEIVWLI